MSSERRATLSLSSIFAFRMLGLFMVLPVLALYVNDFKAATPTLIGLALGIYGLTQALLQIPFGMLSDKFGRKPIIAIGLSLFAIGSIVAATSTSIYGVILGRALQGAGAVGSTIIALLADLTTEENRTKAMATIGLTIGFAFMAAMVVGPILNGWVQLSGIFWLTAALAIAAIGILFSWVPSPKKLCFHRDAEPVPALFKAILKNKELLRLDFGILASHAILTANFVAIPIILEQFIGISEHQQWTLYLPVLILAFIGMLPMIIIAEKFRKMKPMFIFAVSIMTLTQFSFWLFHSRGLILALLLFVFFTVFTFLEASLPSLVSKQAPAGSKGTAMGVYSSSQFLGIFLGGAGGGWLYGQHHLTAVFLGCGILSLIWLLLAVTMQHPPYLATKIINVGNIDPTKADSIMLQLLKVRGVAEANVVMDEGVAYLKVDNKYLDTKALAQAIHNL